jgi:hypothetical protein
MTVPDAILALPRSRVCRETVQNYLLKNKVVQQVVMAC